MFLEVRERVHWERMVKDKFSNDSRSNDARFTNKLYLSLHAIIRLTGGFKTYTALKGLKILPNNSNRA